MRKSRFWQSSRGQRGPRKPRRGPKRDDDVTSRHNPIRLQKSDQSELANRLNWISLGHGQLAVLLPSYPPLPTDPFSIVSARHTSHIQVENNAGGNLGDSQSIDWSLARYSITVTLLSLQMPMVGHRSLPEMTHCFNKPEQCCHVGRGYLRQPENVENVNSEFCDGHGTSEAIRMLGHASVLNTLATSCDILCHFT
jgi:hypothetical protein